MMCMRQYFCYFISDFRVYFNAYLLSLAMELGSYHTVYMESKMLFFHCCVILPYKGKNMPAYYTVQSRLNRFIAEGGRSKKCSGIINILFGVMVECTR